MEVLDAGQAEIAYFQIAVLVHEDVAWLQVSVDDPGGMEIFQASLERLAGLLMPTMLSSP